VSPDLVFLPTRLHIPIRRRKYKPPKMNNPLSEFQDLTLNFLGDKEYLILVPKSQSTIKEEPELEANAPNKLQKELLMGSAIIAKKITNTLDLDRPTNNEPQNSSTNEDLDSKTYSIYYEGNAYNASNLKTFAQKINKAVERESKSYPTSSKIIVSEENLRKFFHIVGILNVERLKVHLLEDTETPNQNDQWLHYIEVFPESKNTLEGWLK
jgi:hypothetical protein